MGTPADGHHVEPPAGGHPPALSMTGRIRPLMTVKRRPRRMAISITMPPTMRARGKICHTASGGRVPAPLPMRCKVELTNIRRSTRHSKRTSTRASIRKSTRLNSRTSIWDSSRTIKHQIKQQEKPSDKQTGKPPAPGENAISRFIRHPLDEGLKVYKELVAHANSDAPAHPHLDKLKPNERAQKHIKEYDANGRTFHYDDHGRIASVEGKNKPTLIVAYDKNGQPDGVKVFKADGQMQAKYAHQAHVDLRVNQTTGEVVATQKSVFRAEDARADLKDVPSIKEEHITADGVKSVLHRDLKGHRQELSGIRP